MRRMRLPSGLFTLLLSLLGSGIADAQTHTSTNTTAAATPTPILQPGVLPPCALTCQNLKKAELICEPSTAAGVFTTNQTAYHDCFCNSNLTTILQTSPNGVCDVECPAQADRVKIQDWYVVYCNIKAATTSTTSSPTAVSSTAAATTSAKPSGKRRNGLSKNATIGIAVGISVAMILIALAVYFPLFKAALFAVRHKIPPAIIEDDREKGPHESGVTKTGAGGGAKLKDDGRGSGSESDTTRVHVITAFKE
jgi:hypothetical protein